VDAEIEMMWLMLYGPEVVEFYKKEKKDEKDSKVDVELSQTKLE
jgi:hypothetical protein